MRAILTLGTFLSTAYLAACGGAPAPQTPSNVDVPPPQTVVAPLVTSATSTPEPPSKPPPAASGPKVTAVPGTSIRFEGGDGKTQDHPIKIVGALGESDGTKSEYQYLEMAYGKGTWKMLKQALLESNGKKLDELDIAHQDGSQESVYFDISDYFGKM